MSKLTLEQILEGVKPGDLPPPIEIIPDDYADMVASMRSDVRIAIQAARELYAERGEDARTGELCRVIIGALEKSE